MSVISFATSKGGAGKTTACIVLATTFADQLKVSIIDADPAYRINRWAEKGSYPKNITVIKCADENKIMDVIEAEQKISDVVLVDLEGVASKLNSYVFSMSDLVVGPTGDEQQDIEDAILTLKQIKLDSRATRRDIPVKILFTRTKAAVKSRLEKKLNKQMRENVDCFKTELKTRTAFSSIHNSGGSLDSLPSDVSGVNKAKQNAKEIAMEIITTFHQVRKRAVA
ncbi:MAG: AAA family ATPase [Aestuariivita sp.]|nr:AAA family ATPase [Aestuariivita sp.]